MDLSKDPGTKCLIFGKADSGKTRFVYEYATSILTETEGVCLIVARKSKAERKLVIYDENPCLNRILYKWVSDPISLINVASGLHLHSNQNLQVLVI